MSSLKQKLLRHKKEMQLPKQQDLVGETDKQSQQEQQLPYMEEWQDFQARPYHLEDSYTIIREARYPLTYQHGIYRFSELLQVIDDWKQLGFSHPLSSAYVAEDNILFFDTETTGLGTGTGNLIFLLGYAKIENDHVIVKQHFLPTPDAEAALYHGFLTDIGDIDKYRLTTYNGKAFDWPQVKTRHTFVREKVPQLPKFGHFDLLHGARRLWKNKLPSVKLAIVEKEILGVVRKNDVPGYLAPMIYFDFLKDPNPRGIKDVFTHNELDVLTLITLYIHLSKCIQGTFAAISEEEKFEVARWFEYIQQYDIAADVYRSIHTKEATQKAALLEARLFKKNNEYVRAVEVLEAVKEKNDEVFVELSKLYEHHLKDFELAYYYAKESFAQCSKQNCEDYVKRLRRLEKKLKKGNILH